VHTLSAKTSVQVLDQHISEITSFKKGKGKVVPMLFFNRAPCHDSMLEEWKYSSMHSLILALDGCQ